MKLISFIFILVGFLNISATSIDLHFLIEPLFPFKAKEEIGNNLRKITINDTIPSYTFICGNIFDKKENDKKLIQFLNSLPVNYAAPVDYKFTANDIIDSFTLLSTNIATPHLPLKPYELIIKDSLKIGIITINSPDQLVKNNILNEAHMNYNFFEKTKQISQDLQSKTNFIILLSNLSKEIEEDLVHDTSIDVVISFDYQSKKNEILSNKKTYWYSTKANKNNLGTLQIKYKNGIVRHQWINKKVHFYEKSD